MFKLNFLLFLLFFSQKLIMRNQARLVDLGVAVCCCHSGCVGTIGTIIPSQSHSKCDERSIARMGDIVIFSCGHIGVIVSGSSLDVTVESGAARIGDAIVGCPIGIISTGSSLTMIN